MKNRIEERYFLELAGRASSGMSFSPEKRAKDNVNILGMLLWESKQVHREIVCSKGLK